MTIMTKMTKTVLYNCNAVTRIEIVNCVNTFRNLWDIFSKNVICLIIKGL